MEKLQEGGSRGIFLQSKEEIDPQHTTFEHQDSDFNDLTSFHGFPPKVIWIRSGNLKTKQIADLLAEYLNELDSFLANSEYGCFEIVDFRK